MSSNDRYRKLLFAAGIVVAGTQSVAALAQPARYSLDEVSQIAAARGDATALSAHNPDGIIDFGCTNNGSCGGHDD